MKFLAVLAITVACANVSALKPNGVPRGLISILGKRSVDSQVAIASSTFDSTPEGNFQYGYQAENGIAAQVEGVVQDPNTDKAILRMKGFFRYPNPNSPPNEVTWTADENGFVAKGNHLPVGPAIPEGILRGLQYIKDHPQLAERVFYKPL